MSECIKSKLVWVISGLVILLLAITTLLVIIVYEYESKSSSQSLSDKNEIKNDSHENVDLIENNNKGAICEPTRERGILVVNKKHCLPKDYDPNGLTDETMSSWNEMKAMAKKDGINLNLQSGYRSYKYQIETYNYWVNLYGKEYADTVSARPGYSEHQTGMAIDVSGTHGCDLETCFGNTEEGRWLKNNAHKYGFIIRYAAKEEDLTGYSEEPWHIRYIGSEAENIKQSGKSLEEYLNIEGGKSYAE